MTSWHPDRSTRTAARAAALLGCALLLAACSSDGGEWLSLVKAARLEWENRDAPVALEEAGAIPYATLGMRIEGGREHILVLATDNQGVRTWAASGGFALTTRYGRLVQTAGFGTDLTNLAPQIKERDNWTSPHRFTELADFRDLGVYQALIVCDVHPTGPDPIEILGKRFETNRIDELCRSDSLGWSFTNSFWVSPETGRVWRSVQHFHPKGPEVELQYLRPPLSEG